MGAANHPEDTQKTLGAKDCKIRVAGTVIRKGWVLQGTEFRNIRHVLTYGKVRALP